MVQGVSKRVFRRSSVDQFPLYAILIPEPVVSHPHHSLNTTTPISPAAGATPTVTTPASPAPPATPSNGGAPLGVWCLFLNSMYCPNTIAWSRTVLKQRGFKLVGYWIPNCWATPEWMARAHAIAAASGAAKPAAESKSKPKKKRRPSDEDMDGEDGEGDETDQYDIHEQINDPSTLDLPAPNAATGSASAAGGVNTEVLFTVRDCWDVDRHLPMLEQLEQCLKRYLKDAFELEYTGDSDELEVVFHYPVQTTHTTRPDATRSDGS